MILSDTAFVYRLKAPEKEGERFSVFFRGASTELYSAVNVAQLLDEFRTAGMTQYVNMVEYDEWLYAEALADYNRRIDPVFPKWLPKPSAN